MTFLLIEERLKLKEFVINAIIFTDCMYFGWGRSAGAYRIATELRQSGYSCQVVEFFMTLKFHEIKKIFDLYLDSSTLFVGISSTLLGPYQPMATYKKLTDHIEGYPGPQWGSLPKDDHWVLQFKDLILSKNSNTKLVVGGSRATYTDLAGIDYWLQGFSDRAVVQLARHLDSGQEVRTYKIEDSPGYVIRGNDDYPYENFNSSVIEWTAQDGLDRSEFLPIEIARGCRFRCSFCAYPMNGKAPNTYIKSSEALRSELTYNFERFGITNYIFCDDTYNDSLEKVERLYHVFTSLPFKIQWIAYCRLDVLAKYPQMYPLLKEAGLISTFFGIETLSAKARRSVGKGLTPEQAINELYRAREQWGEGVLVEGGFIFGLPGETEDEMRNTMEWLQRPDCPLDSVAIEPFSVDPKPKIYKSKISLNPEKYGLKINGDSQWTSHNTNYQRAAAIVDEYYAKTDGTNKLASFNYARIRNLNQSHEQVRPLTYKQLTEKGDFYTDLYSTKRALYLDQLLRSAPYLI